MAAALLLLLRRRGVLGRRGGPDDVNSNVTANKWDVVVAGSGAIVRIVCFDGETGDRARELPIAAKGGDMEATGAGLGRAQCHFGRAAAERGNR